MGTLRWAQSFLSLDDDNLADLDSYHDRKVQDLPQELSEVSKKAVNEIVELSLVGASLFEDDRYDSNYASSISQLSTMSKEGIGVKQANKTIRQKRKKLL